MILVKVIFLIYLFIYLKIDLSGFVDLSTVASEGTIITLRHGEILFHNGLI